MPGLAITPPGFMASAETTPPQLMQSFFHMAVVMSSVVETAIGEAAKRATKASPASPSGTMIVPVPRWRMRPGAARSAGMSTTQGTMRSGGTRPANRETCSTPFCSTATLVAGPIRAASHGWAAAAS